MVMRYDPTEVSKVLELMKDDMSNESLGNDDDEESTVDYNESLKTIGSTRGGHDITSHRENDRKYYLSTEHNKVPSERQFKMDHPHISFGSSHSRGGSMGSSSICSEDFLRSIGWEENHHADDLRAEKSKKKKKSSSFISSSFRENSNDQIQINVAASNIFGKNHPRQGLELLEYDDIGEREKDKMKRTRLETLHEISDSLRSSIGRKSSDLRSSITQKLVRGAPSQPPTTTTNGTNAQERGEEYDIDEENNIARSTTPRSSNSKKHVNCAITSSSMEKALSMKRRRRPIVNESSSIQFKKAAKQMITVAFIASIIILFSIMMGIIIPSDNDNSDTTTTTNGNSNNLDDPPSSSSKQPSPTKSSNQENMLQLAEQIIETCNENQFASSLNGRKGCQDLCRGHMCCVLPKNDGGNCREEQEDVKRSNARSHDCAIYMGCEILLTPDPTTTAMVKMDSSADYDDTDVDLDEADEDEETKVDKGSVESEGGDGGAATTADFKAMDVIPIKRTYTDMEKFELAEELNRECNDSSRDDALCREICRSHMCCFYEENDCVDDERALCTVYAGCEQYYLEEEDAVGEKEIIGDGVDSSEGGHLL